MSSKKKPKKPKKPRNASMPDAIKRKAGKHINSKKNPDWKSDLENH